MNNHPEWVVRDHLLTTPLSARFPDQDPKINALVSYSGLSKVITAVTLLTLSFYVLTFFDAWPSTIKRSSYETFVYLVPSPVIYALQYVLQRFAHTSPVMASQTFRRADFGNQQAKAQALQHIFGNSPIPNIVQRARRLSGLSNIVTQGDRIGPPGLGNWDNSCYQNSILQGLASLPAFSRYIERSKQFCENFNTPSETHEALAAFLSQLRVTDIHRTTLWTPKILKSMDSWEQQDAQEYFSRILEAVEKETLKYGRLWKRGPDAGLDCVVKQDVTSENLSIMNRNEASPKREQDNKKSRTALLKNIVPESRAEAYTNRAVSSLNELTNPIDGMLAQTLKCETCGYSEGISLTQFNCLTVNMGLRGDCQLEDLLDEYTKAETVEDVECTNCTKMEQPKTDRDSKPKSEIKNLSSLSTKPRRKPILRKKAKQITVGRLPKDLIIHINRSIFDDFGNQRKNTSLVQFPSKLDFLHQWCPQLDVPGDNVQPTYNLKSVVTHQGRHENGHYVALGQRDKEWYCFNDEIVTQVSEQQVLNRGNVFMLFYETVEALPPSRMQARIATETNIKQRANVALPSITSLDEIDSRSNSPSPVEFAIPRMRTASHSHTAFTSNPITTSHIVSAI